MVGGGPGSAIVVGAGVVGLSTAWFLQGRGVDVTVVDRTGVAAGGSWGNDGWIAPGLALPLWQPSWLRHGLSALADPRFSLATLLASVQRRSWHQAMRAGVALNQGAIDVVDTLVSNGVGVPVTDTPITAVFRTGAAADQLLRQLREVELAGQHSYVTALSGDALREQVPLASPAITAGLNINGQRFVDPRRFVEALAESLTRRGGVIRRLDVNEISRSAGGVAVRSGRAALTADAVVIATGARLSALAGQWLRVPVRAGHGYSFTVPVRRPVPSPVYLPDVQVRCTPHRGALRVSGAMELRRASRELIPRRVDAIATAAGPLLDGVCWEQRRDVWVGGYPVVPDGRPLVGAVSPGIFVAGGHGVWGMAHGPVTGRLLAEQIVTGRRPPALTMLDPLRRNGECSAMVGPQHNQTNARQGRQSSGAVASARH